MRGYYISEILLDTYYRGRRGEGVIVEARKRDDVLKADNAYAVRVQACDSLTGAKTSHDFWATIFIAEEN